MTSRSRPRFAFTGIDQPPAAAGSGSSPSPAALPAAGAPAARETAVPVSGRAPSRAGKRAVTFYVSPDAFRQLAVLAATSDRSIQDLMGEATDLLFQENGLARIARE